MLPDAAMLTLPRIRLTVFVALCLAHLMFTVWMNPYGTIALSGTEFEEYEKAAIVRCLLGGVMYSQPVLLALAGVLGPYALAKQLPLAASGLVLLDVASALGSSDSSVLIWMPMSFGVALITLIAVRRLSGLRILLKLKSNNRAVLSNQFGTRWLFVITAAAATACALLHYCFEGKSFRSIRASEMLEWVPLISIASLGAALFSLCMLASFYFKRLAVACAAISLLSVYLVARIAWPAEPEQHQIRAVFQCGTILAIAATLLPFRWCGYRLVRGTDQHEAAVDAGG